jgi:hypothetical protein
MIDDLLTHCPACGAPGKTTYTPADEDGPDCWCFSCSDWKKCGWEWNEVDHPITPRSVIASKIGAVGEVPCLQHLFTLTFGADLDPRTPMHAREIWRLAALTVGADPNAAMQALLKPTSASSWVLYIGAEEVYFVGEAPTIEEATAMLKGMLL